MMTFYQGLPGWINEGLFKWIDNNGFAVVAFVLLLALVITPLFVIVRALISDVGRKSEVITGQIAGAVTLFSATLSTMSDRQQTSTDRLSDAIRQLVEIQSETQRTMVGMGKSQDITLRFISENMKEIVAHRATVEPDYPTGGVISPVTQEET